MASISVTSSVNGLGAIADRGAITSCSCALCAAAAADGVVRTSVMAAGLSEDAGSVRAATLIAQFLDSDGYYKYSGDRNIDAVLIGSKWTSTTLTFSFPDSTDDYPAAYDYGQALRVVEFNDAQQAAARAAFEMVSGYTNLTFVEVAPSDEQPTFRLSSTALPDVGSAMGYFPGTVESLGGDIWFGRTEQPYYETPEVGNWGFSTILHEIGHTLGLKHGHSDYTDGDVSDYFGTDNPRYGSRALEYAKDGQAWSVMTYTIAPDIVNDYNGDEVSQPQTYMMYDIAALQYLYGANYTTNATDTVYQWNSETGAMSINGVAGATPAGNKVLSTIWDGGGNDTYDLSNYTGNMAIDLRPGELSTISTAQLGYAQSYYDNGDAVQPGNIGNALLFEGNTASLIENAIGGSGNDWLIGNGADNRLDGGSGDDLLAGGVGSDVLIGGAGNDVADFSDATTGISVTFNNNIADIIVANGTDRDTLRGIEGAIGTAFNDTLTGDGAANILSGGSGGRDYLNGGDGNDTLVGATDTVTQVDKADIVKGADWYNQAIDAAIDLTGAFDLVDDSLVERATELPHASVDAVGAGGGQDYYRFTATAGSEAIFDIDGVAPSSTVIEILDAAGNVVASNFGVARTDAGSREGAAPMLEHVFQATGTYYVRIGELNYGYDEGTGTTYPISTSFRADTAYLLNVSVENASVETIVAAVGSGRFYGGAGDDLIVASSGDDLISGGAGIDTVSYANARNRVTVDLAVTRAQQTGAGSDLIGGVENLVGSRYSDTLRGNAGDNVIDGGGGSDRISGGAGRDTLSFASQTDAVTYNLALQERGQTATLGSNVWASGFEDLTGGGGDDVLIGDASANRISGGAGDDVLAGDSDGIAGAAADVLDGGEGRDTASFFRQGAGVTVTLQAAGAGVAYAASGALLATLAGIEAIAGSAYADVLTGNADANTLSGSDGADILAGNGGDDVLDGGQGDDSVDGGAGIDTVVYAGWSSATVDLAITTAQDTGYGIDSLTGIENIASGYGNDALFGNDADNVFEDGGGDDLYVGRAGIDTVDYSSASGLLVVDLGLTYQQNTRAAGFDLIDGSIENVVGGDGGNVLTGSAAANRLTGGASVDALFGAAGDDVLIGGDGDDLLIGDMADGSDTVGGRDALYGGRGADRLVGGSGDDLLSGGSGNDLLVSGDVLLTQYDTSFVIEGLVAVDGGRDTIDGGEGLDEAVIYYAGRSEAIEIDNRVTDATNAITYDGVAIGSLTSIETLRFLGGDGNDRVFSGAGYDVLQGGGGDDLLWSGLGDDIVVGGAGNDTMDGGEGFDQLSYANATSGITLDLRREDAQDTGGAGIDTVRNFENVSTSAFSDVIYGNDGSNTIRDYNGGDDVVYGLGGSDSLGVFRQYGQPEQTIYLDGGDDSDVVEYYSEPVYDASNPAEFYRQTDTVTLIGGAGRDGIWMVGQKVGVIDAGSGDDQVTIGIGGLAETSLDITLGSGSDDLVIGYFDYDIGRIDRTSNLVRDFETGDLGDRLNITGILQGWDTGANPFTTGQLKLVQSDDDVILTMDMDGARTEFDWRSILTFENTEVADFTATNFFVTDPDGVIETSWDPQSSAQSIAAFAGDAQVPAVTIAEDAPAAQIAENAPTVQMTEYVPSVQMLAMNDVHMAFA